MARSTYHATKLFTAHGTKRARQWSPRLKQNHATPRTRRLRTLGPVTFPLMTSSDDSYDLSMAAATLRANSSDVHILLNSLCQELSDTLGTRLIVQRSGGRFKKPGAISSLSITMEASHFDAVVDGGNVRCSIGHLSGGIRIRNESVSMDDWILKLLQALQSEATHSQVARQALENIVIGGNR